MKYGCLFIGDKYVCIYRMINISIYMCVVGCVIILLKQQTGKTEDFFSASQHFGNTDGAGFWRHRRNYIIVYSSGLYAKSLVLFRVLLWPIPNLKVPESSQMLENWFMGVSHVRISLATQYSILNPDIVGKKVIIERDNIFLILKIV